MIQDVPTEEELVATFGGERGVWGEHPDYPREDWKHEVANDETVNGYWTWVTLRIEEAAFDGE
ncbi:hypothetical protein V6O07_12410, partial [Arthrospira platensis SPKY2]